MKGANPRRPRDRGDGGTLWVQEVFYTLQGEGPLQGTPAVFVRLAGCNLACAWCDTDFESSTWRPALAEVLEAVERARPPHCDLVVLTGGEPLRQNVTPLLEELLARGLRVQIETNGTLHRDLPDDPRVEVICSPKTARLSPRLLPRITAFKYVLAEGEVDPADGLPARSTQDPKRPERLARPRLDRPVYVMPRDDADPEANARHLRECVAVALQRGYRVTTQAHKTWNVP